MPPSATWYRSTRSTSFPVQFRDSPAALFYQQPGFTQNGSATGARVDQNRITLDGLDVSDQALGGVSVADGAATAQSNAGSTANNYDRRKRSGRLGRRVPRHDCRPHRQ